MTTGSLIPDNGSDSRLFSQFWYLQGIWFYLGATTAAVAVIGIDLVGLAAVFVYGSLRKRVIREVHVDDADLIVE